MQPHLDMRLKYIRYIWMEKKNWKSFFNLNEANLANDLISNNIIKHEPSKIVDFQSIPESLDEMLSRKSFGKISILHNKLFKIEATCLFIILSPDSKNIYPKISYLNLMKFFH